MHFRAYIVIYSNHYVFKCSGSMRDERKLFAIRSYGRLRYFSV
jgi:hypothetical protein